METVREGDRETGNKGDREAGDKVRGQQMGPPNLLNVRNSHSWTL